MKVVGNKLFLCWTGVGDIYCEVIMRVWFVPARRHELGRR